MFALKLILVPCFLALISLAGRKWGPGVAGWLAGLPVVAGPTLFFLALEHGAQFAADAATASLAAICAATCFNLAYATACVRLRWPLAAAAGLAAWGTMALLLAQLPPSPWASLLLTLPVLLLAPRLFPRVEAQRAGSALPPHELVLRMAAGVCLVLTVTAAAETLGPRWSGLFTIFPVMGLVLALFSHNASGPAYTVTLLRAMMAGFYSLAAFALGLALLLPSYGLGVAFVLSLAFALGVQWPVRRLSSGNARRVPWSTGGIPRNPDRWPSD